MESFRGRSSLFEEDWTFAPSSEDGVAPDRELGVYTVEEPGLEEASEPLAGIGI